MALLSASPPAASPGPVVRGLFARRGRSAARGRLGSRRAPAQSCAPARTKAAWPPGWSPLLGTFGKSFVLLRVAQPWRRGWGSKAETRAEEPSQGWCFGTRVFHLETASRGTERREPPRDRQRHQLEAVQERMSKGVERRRQRLRPPPSCIKAAGPGDRAERGRHLSGGWRPGCAPAPQGPGAHPACLGTGPGFHCRGMW